MFKVERTTDKETGQTCGQQTKSVFCKLQQKRKLQTYSFVRQKSLKRDIRLRIITLMTAPPSKFRNEKNFRHFLGSSRPVTSKTASKKITSNLT